MEYRQLGGSGLKVPVLSYGTGTFGGKGDFFQGFGSSDAQEATRMVDIALEAGMNMFDSADVYSGGLAEEILGAAIKGRRDQVLISTKATFTMGPGPNDVGSSRYHLIKSCEESLRRLGTDYIDLYQMHAFDAISPVEETMSTLDDLVRAGKIRYIGCSNFSGWHLMKSLAYSGKFGKARYVAHQAYYSLIGRDYEWELMPLGLDQRVGAVVWSPLGWGRLTGRIRRGQPLPESSRLQNKVTADGGPQVDEEYLQGGGCPGRGGDRDRQDGAASRAELASTAADSVVSDRWRQNRTAVAGQPGAVGWDLSRQQVAKLDAASEPKLPYPYWHQYGFSRNPFPVKPGG